MKNAIASTLLLSFLAISCGERTETGFADEWEGQTIIVNSSGKPVTSDIKAEITFEKEDQYECEITVNGQVHQFYTYGSGTLLTHTKEPVRNVSDSLRQTYITGDIELVGDTLLKFEHVVFVMEENVHISSQEYALEMKRK